MINHRLTEYYRNIYNNDVMIQDNNFGIFGVKMNDIAAYHYLGIVKSGEM